MTRTVPFLLRCLGCTNMGSEVRHGGREESRIGFIIEKLWNRRSAMSCILFYFFLFIVDLYSPPPLLGIYLVLWARWPWDIARSCRKIVGDKYIYNGTHSSMSLTLSQWSDGPETFCGLLCCGKQALMFGRPGDLRVCECAPSVSLPYKSDHEWKRGWCHDNVQDDIWAGAWESIW